MPRRASSKSNPVRLLVVLLVVAVALGGGAFVWTTLSDPYRTLTPIDVQAYLDNANSLRGNVYKFSGTIDSELAWSPDGGRLYSVLADGSKTDVIPLLVPPQLSSVNIQKDQRYDFKIEVGDKGVLTASGLKKI